MLSLGKHIRAMRRQPRRRLPGRQPRGWIHSQPDRCFCGGQGMELKDVRHAGIMEPTARIRQSSLAQRAGGWASRTVAPC